MKKLIVLLFGVVLFFGGCEHKATSENEKIKIGVIAPLTGEGATYGASMKRGLELVFKEKRKKYKIIFEDSKLSVKDGIHAYNKLINYKPYIIYGAAASGVSLGLVSLATKNKTVLFSSISTSDKLEDSSKYFVRTVPTNFIQGQTAAEFLIQKLKIKKIALFNENDEYGTNLAKSFKEEISRLGNTVLLEDSYSAKQNNFKTFLTKLKINNIRAVFIPGNYEETALILKQAKELSLSDIIFIGGDGSYSPKISEIAGKDINNFYCTIMGFDKSSTFYNKFLKKFKASYDIEPDTYDAYAYEASTIILNILENSKRKSDVLEYLYTHEYDSLDGKKLKFNNQGNVARKYEIVKLVKGIFKEVQ